MPWTPIKRNLRIKKNIEKGVCRLIEMNKSCENRVKSRGMCAKHNSSCSRDGTTEKYGAPIQYEFMEDMTITVKKKIKPSVCRLEINGKPCKRKTHGREVCALHYLRLERYKLLEKYGGPSRKDPRTFSTRESARDGTCWIVEDKKNCNRKTSFRGLCIRHNQRFFRDGTKEKFARW